MAKALDDLLLKQLLKSLFPVEITCTIRVFKSTDGSLVVQFKPVDEEPENGGDSDA